ncbi:MAG: hypothetical protein Q7W44_01235 [Coriobacteriia bacterium]|nr:hypothetical protein [Coriobacteriia bacterium]
MSDLEGLTAEYEMLQGEINSNSQVTANVFAITVTGVAALIGYGVQTGNWLVLLSPFALLIPSLWFIASQVESTVRIATYVRTFIEPRVAGLHWETRLSRIRMDHARPDSRYTLSITGIYGLLGAACLGLAWALVGRSPQELISMGVATVLLGGSTIFVSIQCRRALSTGCQCDYTASWEALAREERESAASDSKNWHVGGR